MSARPTRRASPPLAQRRFLRPATLKARLRKIKLLLCDVDGVLTDGTVFVGEHGEFKQFNILDGLGLRLLQKNGIQVGWLSARPSVATAARARELKVDFLIQDPSGKVAAAEALLKKIGLSWNEVCYIGDDVVDLGVLRRAGVAITPPHGIAACRAMAHYVTRTAAGHGAVREVTDLLLAAQGQLDRVIAEFSQ